MRLQCSKADMHCTAYVRFTPESGTYSARVSYFTFEVPHDQLRYT